MFQISHTWRKHQVSTKRMFDLVASNSIFFFCLERRIYITTLLNSLPVLIISLNGMLNPLPVLIVLLNSRCVEDTPGDTLVHTLVYDKYSPARWVSRKLRPKSKTIPCYTVLLLSSIQCPIFECVWFCNVTSDLYRETVCHVRNRHRANRTAWLEWLLNHLQ